MPKRTYQPSKRRRRRKFGFRKLLRMAKKGSRLNILKRKRAKGRHKLSVVQA